MKKNPQNKFHNVPIEPNQQSKSDLDQYDEIGKTFDNAKAPTVSKIEAFSRFVSRPALSRFISRYEVFKKVLNVPGSIIECGVFHGAGLFAFAKISSILEPTNHTRKIIGFDTFEGFPDIDKIDSRGGATVAKPGGFKGSDEIDILSAIDLFNMNRPLSHLNKIEVINGDITSTAPKYVKDNPHLVVSLLNLDLDLYKPTKVALEAFLPCMPKGGIIIFDELNAKRLPGETVAIKEILNLQSLRIQRFVHDTYFSYVILD